LLTRDLKYILVEGRKRNTAANLSKVKNENEDYKA